VVEQVVVKLFEKAKIKEDAAKNGLHCHIRMALTVISNVPY
jgi:hypothetical protein